MLRVALTGNVASGKSAVAAVWREAGVPVVSADDLAREVVEPGTEGLEAVRAAFGVGVLGPDGGLDRAAVRERVFRDEGARRRLEAILHPRIRAREEVWLRERAGEGTPLAVTEIPLLFEVGREADYDVTVLVDAPAAVRRERMVRTRGFPPEEAARIMASQMDPAEKRRRADMIVDNDGTLEALRARALEVLETLRASASAGGGDP